MSSHQQIETACEYIRSRWDIKPSVAMVLGSGLGSIAEEINIAESISYSDIPHFVQSTVAGHSGELICGELSGQPIVAMRGRFHKYEGYSWEEITIPTRVLCELGIELLIVSNAAGGLNWKFSAGDIMMLDSHVDLLFSNRVGGTHYQLSQRANRSIVQLYDRELLEIASEVARREQFVLHRGVYFSVSGPTYETRAEYRMFRKLGADAVGMSTVPEVCIAAQCGVRIVGISTITNVAQPDIPTETTHSEVVETAKSAEKNIRKLVMALVARAF